MTPEAGAGRKPVVAVVDLDRPGSMGAVRRTGTLREVFEAAGAEVVLIGLLGDHRRAGWAWLRLPVGKLVRGVVLPESAVWTLGSLSASLAELEPDVVVCETARAYDPELAQGRWMLVLDFVDRLSESYADRSRIAAGPAQRLLFRTLAATARRFEERPLPPRVALIAAGRADAEALGATWVPNTCAPLSAHSADPTHDVVFFGNLSYPPNVAAVERLGRMWPKVVQARPTTTLLLAGARLLPAQADLAARLGWDVAADFDDLAELLAGTRLAVAPVDHASGIQNKVLEAAAAGLAQVITPQVAAGLDPDFPAVVAADDRQFVAEVVRLLDDDDGRRALGHAARQHLATHYSPASLTPWAATIIEAAATPGG